MKTIIILIIVLAANAYSQVSEEWVKRYNSLGANSDAAVDITSDAAGNVYVLGYEQTTAQGRNYLIFKYNPAGSTVWSAFYNGDLSGDDTPTSIAVDASGNVYVTGYGLISNSADFITVKYNSAGVQQWVRTHHNSNDFPTKVAVDAAGNVYVTGTCTASPYGRTTTIKYNSAGTVQWTNSYYIDQNYCGASDLEIDASGNVYICGIRGMEPNADILLVKYSPAGTELWVRIYTSTYGIGNTATDLTLDAAGNIYVVGTQKAQNNYQDLAVLKYNPSGTLQWSQRYNGTGNQVEQGAAISVDAAGNVYAAGGTNFAGNNGDALLVKYNSAGAEQWVRTYNGPASANDLANSMTLDAAGNIFITGYSGGLGTGQDYFTARYNPAGTQIWVQRYLGPGNDNDNTRAITLGPGGTVYVTGSSIGTGTGTDYATVKYAQTVGIQQIGNEVPDNFSLGQNYPNPFNPMTNIKIQMPNAGHVNLAVYDITGKEVSLLVNKTISAGTYNVDFDGSNLSSGTYFYRLETEGYSEIKKMVLIK